MKVHFSIEDVPEFDRAVVTIGTFDGVHRGHQKILSQLKAEAERIGGKSVIITFHPHPRKVVHSGKPPFFLINTIEERITLLRESGIDHLVVIPFTESFSQLSASAYVEDFLVRRFHPHTVIIGYDHRFGHDRLGNYQLLESYSAKGYFELKEIPEHLINSSIVSSTRIREAVLHGQMEDANELLGYPFFFEGLVTHGNRLGHSLGFPTANLRLENAEKLIPGDGVYAVKALLSPSSPSRREDLDSKAAPLKGMMNIGNRPTVGGHNRMIEVHLFDWNLEIYDQYLRVQVTGRLRGEQKFPGLEELKLQLGKDREAAMSLLG